MDTFDAMVLWVFVLPILIIVLTVVAARRFDARQVRTLRRDGHTIHAHVTGLGTYPGDGMTSTAYWADVACPSDAFTGRVNLEHGQYKTLQAGSRVEVTYLPGRRSSARILH
ncbi:MAG TPA: hypothetical protein VFU73_13895 [Actinocrinis sp.]|nr:hypothetical protein [Actinocrinis sp.]